jgi:hypothetical protein
MEYNIKKDCVRSFVDYFADEIIININGNSYRISEVEKCLRISKSGNETDYIMICPISDNKINIQ